FLWTGIDYMGEAGKWPNRSNGAGLLDLAGNPKADFYFRKSIWTDEPMININVAPISANAGNRSFSRYGRLKPSWNWDANQRVRIVCYTNCNEAELFLNGKSLGKKPLIENKMIVWDTTFIPGELVAKAYKNGEEQSADTLFTAQNAVGFKTKIYKPLFKEPEAMAQVEVQLVDAANHPASDDREVTVKVIGDGELAGLESADNNSHEDYKSNHRKTKDGKLLIFIKNTKGKEGKIKLILTSPGLEPKTVQL